MELNPLVEEDLRLRKLLSTEENQSISLQLIHKKLVLDTTKILINKKSINIQQSMIKLNK